MGLSIAGTSCKLERPASSPWHNAGSNPSCSSWNGNPRIGGNHAHCYTAQAAGACNFTYHNGAGWATAPGCADGNPNSWCWAQYVGLTCGTPLGYFRLADVRDPGELGGGERLAAQERREDIGAGAIADQRGDSGDSGTVLHDAYSTAVASGMVRC